MKKFNIFWIIAFFVIVNSIAYVSAQPDFFDWRDEGGKNWMTDVRQQGGCGSCWAFSTLGAFEAQYNIDKDDDNFDLNLSEEYLVSDCYTTADCCGMPGTNLALVLSYLRDDGTPDEECLEYEDTWSCTCSDGTCDTNCNYRTGGDCSDFTCSDRCVDWESRLYNLDSYNSISSNKETIKDHLYNNGPLATVMFWDGAINPSTSQITICQPDSGSGGWHAVVITGYNETGDYWIVKNSHGSNWGPFNDGYFRVGFGECSIQNNAYWLNLSLCECTSWSSGSCGAGSCLDSERQYTRTCTPTGCNVTSECRSDSSCVTGGSEITVCKSGGCDYTVIQDAIDASGTSDLVYVNDSGAYDEQIVMNATTTAWLECKDNAQIYGGGTGIFLNNVDSPAVIGCNITGFDYGISLNSSYALIENNTFINNWAGIYMEYDNDDKHSAKILNNNFTKNTNYAAGFAASKWADSISLSTIEENIMFNNDPIAIYTDWGQDNVIENNDISGSSNYGVNFVGEDTTCSSSIDENDLYDNGYGIYLSNSNNNDIDDNLFCPSSSTTDIDITASTGTTGDENTCDKPGSWNDAGTTGCSYYCDSIPEVMLLDPFNEKTEGGEGNISFTCYAEDNSNLVNITFYHNVTGTWLANQTTSISGLSNTTTFDLINLNNKIGFIWNCLAADNSSRLNYAPNNFTVYTEFLNITDLLSSNETGGIDDKVALGENVTFNATVEGGDVDNVFLKIWERIAETSTILFFGFLDFITGDLWSLDVDTGEDVLPEGQVNYTIYANDSQGSEVSESGNFTIVCPSMSGTGTAASPYEIDYCCQLQDIEDNLTAYYILISDVDCDIRPYNNATGFKPLGTSPIIAEVEEFTGEFLGNNHTINNLKIFWSGAYSGLFAILGNGSNVSDLGFVNVNITGDVGAGALTTWIKPEASISSVFVKGGTISDPSGLGTIGAIAGMNEGTMEDCYAIANVSTGTQYVGGLVGTNKEGLINRSYFAGNVSGTNYIGGLVGYNYINGQIQNSFTDVILSGSSAVGGLVGYFSGTITNCYWNNHSGNPSQCYSGGESGCTAIANDESYFKGDVAGSAPMSSWSFYSIWEENATTYPVLTWEDLGGNIVSDSNRFYIRNLSDSDLAWFGDEGNIVLRGSCVQTATCTAQADSYVFKNSSNDVVAYINSTGDLCIETGDCTDYSSSCSSANNAFVIENEASRVVAHIDDTGDLCLIGELDENGI